MRFSKKSHVRLHFSAGHFFWIQITVGITHYLVEQGIAGQTVFVEFKAFFRGEACFVFLFDCLFVKG